MSNSKKNNNFAPIKKIELDRDIIAHKDSMKYSINYVEKLNLIIIKVKNESIIITRVVYTDYDLLYCLLNYKDKEL